MDYQLPQQMPIGPPTPAPSPHIQIMQNSPQILPSMQPPNSLPNMPLQVIHLPHMNPPNGAQNGGGASQQHNSQNLPPPSQILQVHHQTNGTNGTPNGQTPNGGPNGGMNGNNGANGVNGEEGNRWTQFQVQQLWRHHAYLNGKSGNSKDICGDDKHKEDGDPWNVEAQAAFLGPNLWDKTLPYDADLKVHQYVDLDEFLSENNIPVDGLPGGHLGHSNGLGHRSDSLGHSAGLSLGLSQVTTKRERSPSPSDCVSPDTMNPPSPAESKELKDDKYWARRRKNNIAAKRSRDARRQKENQIAMRARYLEKENMSLQQEVDQLRQENLELRSRLSKYQEV
ncbi:hepatic leukemia factor isoform X7 [Lutzomyia longipalpis]|uniref:hepatic leukemia factor isoform X7 n=1 Tax=Lutzomyia longipalpis TaxID=7200 RepID=UPI0024843713|nr:hepatic leukemia factor isoform X7 [Lutzomyia longipalpis]